MRKTLLLLTSCIFALLSCSQEAKIKEDEIYFFFYDGCPYCHQAMGYINQKYPNLDMIKVDVYQAAGYRLFEACAEKFDLGEKAGTPLFCMGNHYVLGWSKNNEKKFDRFVQPFLKK